MDQNEPRAGTSRENVDEPQPSTSRGGQIEVKKNKAYSKSLKELLKKHKRLTRQRIAVSTRESRIPKIPHGSLLTTVIRMHVSVKNKLSVLRNIFFDLFREHSESSQEGYEVVVTFNAVLENQVRLNFLFFKNTIEKKEMINLFCNIYDI